MNARTLSRFARGAVRYRMTGRRTPLNVMIAVTNRCNARCSYCGIPDRGGEDLPTEALLRIVDDAAAAGAARIGLWGGEPLLRKDLPEIVGRARSHGLWTTVDTNGYLLPRRFRELRDVDHWVISFDGRPENHDRNREPGASKKTLRAIRTAHAEGLAFWTLTVLTRHTLGDIDYVLDTAERFGGRAAFQVLHHPPELTGGRGEDLAASAADYHDAIRRLIAAKKAGRPVVNSLTFLRWLDGLDGFGAPSAEANGRKCLAGELYVNVDADGALYPCSLLAGRPGAPNARDGFAEAFAELEPPECKSCVATAFAEYDLLFGLHPGAVVDWLRSIRHRPSRATG
jgi:MoaA/NifB/PqqE/SkfB family radical SAM enzyme